MVREVARNEWCSHYEGPSVSQIYLSSSCKVDSSHILPEEITRQSYSMKTAARCAVPVSRSRQSAPWKARA